MFSGNSPEMMEAPLGGFIGKQELDLLDGVLGRELQLQSQPVMDDPCGVVELVIVMGPHQHRESVKEAGLEQT